MAKSNANGATVLLIMLSPVGVLAAYVAAYFLMGDRFDVAKVTPVGGVVRLYPYEWQSRIFAPAAKFESLMIGREVEAAWNKPSESFFL